MAEENSQLRSNPSRAWLKRMFGWWKWPGYSTAGLGILRLFHFSEDVDFALKLLRSLGGDLGMIATVVASPFFAIAMVVYGVLHLIFVGEPKQATRHPAWIYIGWAIFAVCFVAIVGSISYGVAQVYIEREVGNRDVELQHRALGGQTFWHMTYIEKISLGSELDKTFESDRFDINIHCSQNTNSRTYTEDIGEIFTAHHWKVNGNCLFNNLKPGLIGVFLAVSKDISKSDELPANAKKLVSMLAAASIQVQLANDNTLPKTEFYLAVGDAPP